MSNKHFSIFFLLCSNFLVISCDKSRTLLKREQNRGVIEDTKSSQADLEIQRRKEIAKNYLDTLARAKETWVDPYDMIAYPVDERQSVSRLEKDDVSVSSEFSEPNFDNDYRPLFSDIRGEVIDPNSVSKDDFDVKKTGKLLSNGRHQICVLESIYVSRWLKMLIYKIERDSDLDLSAVTIPFNHESLNELKQLSNAKNLEITELDEFISNLITKVIIIQRESYDWTILTSSSVILLQGLCLLIASCIIIYILYKCLVYRPMFTFMWFFIVSSVFWNWMSLYQKRIAQHHAQLSMQTSSDCQKSEFNFWQHFTHYMRSFFTTDDCEKYYEALLVNPFWEVSLAVAVSETITTVLVQPLYSGSKALNASVKLLFDGLSFIMIVILMIFLFLIIIMLFNYKLRFPFFMGSLEPCYNRRNYVEDVRSRETFNMLGNKACETALLQEKNTLQGKGITLGLLGNEQKPAIVSSHKCHNINEVVCLKLCNHKSKSSYNPGTPTKLSKDPEELVLRAVQVEDETESGEDCICVDNFDLIGNMKRDSQMHSTYSMRNSPKCAKYSASNVEPAADEDSSIENICAACDKDTSNALSMTVSN